METMRKICDPFLVLLSLLLLPASSTSDSNDFHTAQPRFVCTPIPADADPACVPTAGPGSTGAAHYQSEPPAGWWGASDEAKTTILHLRENLVRQKETILDQRETIRELTAKLALCEAFARSPHDHVGAASDHAYHDNQSGNLIPDSLDSDGAPGAKHREKDVVKHVSSGDVTSSPGQMERMLQALKERLSNLQKRNSSLTYSSSLRELLQRKIETLEEQLHPHDHQHLNDRTDDAGDRGGNRTEAFDEHTDGSHRGGDPGGHQNNEAGGQGYLPRGGYHGNKLETIFNQLHLTGPKRKNNPDAFQLSFPMRSNYMYARVKRALPQEIFALTLCLRLKAGVGPTMGTPFSYSAPGQANEVVLIQWGGNPVELLIDDKAVSVPVTLSDGKWHHVCVTWSTRDGHWESYQDGDLRGSGTDLAPWHHIRAGGVFILGQEQDTLGGRFDATQSFVGELADVQMWSSVLSEAEIQGLASCGSHLAGDVISWSDSDVELHGGVVRHAFEPCH